ncbi:MAG: hypothetical protein COB65_14325 [Thalassobium sp.]|nr:MAG: hypothetical protein COB65_14325 [Thalassobium sp.]
MAQSSNDQCNRALRAAAGAGNISKCQDSLDRGALLEAVDMYGQTPLSKAALYGHNGTIEFLYCKGAKLDAADKDGQTPLWKAALFCHKDTVGLLHSLGANLDAGDKFRWTPLMKGLW